MGDKYGVEFEWESSIFRGRMEKGFTWVEADDEKEAWKKAEKRVKRFKGGSRRKYDLKNIWRV